MKPFCLRRFSIEQSRSAMKVGTDAICLGAWASHLGLSPTTVLDIGAGTGILTLMLAQTYHAAQLVAIELDEGAAQDCEVNFSSSPFAKRCVLVRGDVLQYQPVREGYDLIISNPPYFSETTAAPQAERARARTEDCNGLGLSSLVQYAARYLNQQGRLCLITPVSRLSDLRAYATEALLRLSEVCYLSHLGDEPSRVMTLWVRLQSAEGYQYTTTSHLSIKTRQGSYTAAYKELTRDFLLPEHLDL